MSSTVIGSIVAAGSHEDTNIELDATSTRAIIPANLGFTVDSKKQSLGLSVLSMRLPYSLASPMSVETTKFREC